MKASSPEDVLNGCIAQLEKGWNAADGDQYAEPFAEDADFVAIRGDHHRGKTAIARGHAGIFASIYQGSRVKLELADARFLTDTVILGHVASSLDAPVGPLAGKHNALASVVVVLGASGWRIAAFHNTLVVNAPPRQG